MPTNNTKQSTTNKEAQKTSEQPVEVAKKLSAKEVDMNQYVTVRNGFHGRLFYKSRHSGEKFIWDEFGAEQEMELRELKNAKNSAKKFFINNWFMFDEDWIVDFLGVKAYYKNAVSIEDFDSIFSKSADEIKKIVAEMSDGQKRSAAYRARQLVANGEIDSNRAINALESALGIELVEK